MVLQEVWTICRIFKRRSSCEKQPNRQKAPDSHKQMDTDDGQAPSESTNGEGDFVADYSEILKQQVYDGQFWDVPSPLLELHPDNPSIDAPNLDEFCSSLGGDWDELATVLDFLTD